MKLDPYLTPFKKKLTTSKDHFWVGNNWSLAVGASAGLGLGCGQREE